MLTALAPLSLPGVPPRLPAPARRQDSSGSSSSYHTAPGSPEPPESGPDAERLTIWPWVAPGQGAGAQPRLSVSAQNSRQDPWSGSGFPRGPGSGPRPTQPQLRVLPSGEMEVIFCTGPLFGRSAMENHEVPACNSPSLPRPGSPILASPQPQAPDGSYRWGTYVELQPRGPSPAPSAQFECVEVALEERTATVRNRTVPKRQIELRARPRSPQQMAGDARPRLLLRTGSLDESLGRLQAAASLVQTALARKLAQSSATFGPTVHPEPADREPARSSRLGPEEARSRPPRANNSPAAPRVPRPWPSLRERAIRRDKPAPGTEPLGPVSSSIFLQSEEKIQEVRNQGPKTRLTQRGPPGRTIPRARSPSFEFSDPWEVPGKAVKPRSPSPPWQASNGAGRGPRCPSSQRLSPGDRVARRVSCPSFSESTSERGNQDPAVEEAVSRRNPPSPWVTSQWSQRVARARSPSPEVPCPWEAPYAAGGDTLERRGRTPSPPTEFPWEAPNRPARSGRPPPQETWDLLGQGSSHGALNGKASASEEAAPRTPSAPGTPEPLDLQPRSTREIPDLAFQGCQLSPGVAASQLPHGHLAGPPDAKARPEATSAGDAASGRQRVAIPRPRDVRKIVKTTYAPSFPAAGSAPAPLSLAPALPAEPCREDGEPTQTQELLQAPSPEPSAPAHYTSIFLKDFLPVVPHPYESPELPLDAVSCDAPEPNGIPRRRAENSTAKPFARTEIRLPGALALGRGREGASAVRAPSPSGQSRGVEAQRLVPDGGGRTSPPGGARASPQRSPVRSPPPRPGSPQEHPNSSLGVASQLETAWAAPEPAVAVPAPLAPEPRAAAPRQPRASSAPPTDRSPQCPTQGLCRPPGMAQPGKVLVDPESGRYYFVEAPRQPRLRLLFDPESGQYVEVLLPPSSAGPPRQVYAPLGLGAGLYPPAYAPVPGLSLPPSPGPPALGSPQLPWASELGSLDGLYHLAVSGPPSPAVPPLLLCAPPPSSGPAQPRKGSVFPL